MTVVVAVSTLFEARSGIIDNKTKRRVRSESKDFRARQLGEGSTSVGLKLRKRYSSPSRSESTALSFANSSGAMREKAIPKL